VCVYRSFGTPCCLHPQSVIQVYSVDGGSVLHKASVIANRTRHVIIQKLIIVKKMLFAVLSATIWRSNYESELTIGNSLSCDVTILPITSNWPLCFKIYFTISAFFRDFPWLYLQNISVKWRYGVRGSPVGWGTALQVGRSRLRFPMVSLEFFFGRNPSGRTMALGFTQPLTEMSTRNISWEVKAAGA